MLREQIPLRLFLKWPLKFFFLFSLNVIGFQQIATNEETQDPPLNAFKVRQELKKQGYEHNIID